MPATRLAIETEDESGRRVVRPRGELDLATRGEFADAIQEMLVDGHVNLVVDLDTVAFLDSTGLGALIGARRRAHALGGSLVIRCGNPKLLRLFRATSLDRVFTIEAP